MLAARERRLIPSLRAVAVAAILAPPLAGAQGVAQSAVASSPRLAIGDRVIVKVWPEIKLSDY